jgi:hypothetical protein
VQDLVLYATVAGRTLPVAVGEESGKYQVTWTEQHANAASGTYKVHVYDEDGYVALRKAQRNNEDVSKVATLAIIDLYHPVSYCVPIIFIHHRRMLQGATRAAYIATETVALALAAGIFYAALHFRTQLKH